MGGPITGPPTGGRREDIVKSVTTSGTCPKCGCASFVAKRTKKGVVAAGLFAPKRVRCVACGESLKPGNAPVKLSAGAADAETYTPPGWIAELSQADLKRLKRMKKTDPEAWRQEIYRLAGLR